MGHFGVAVSMAWQWHNDHAKFPELDSEATDVENSPSMNVWGDQVYGLW